MKEMKDSIDFAQGDISKLFRKMLYPTLLGMLFTALFTITDGVFVGRGIGSDALAAINIIAPLYLISTGIGLMFGMGASVVASIHLSDGKLKVARINITQAIVASSLMMILFSGIILLFSHQVLMLLGCSPNLYPLALDYLWGFVPFLTMNMLVCNCGFFVRLSGSPGYSMFCAIVAAIINIILDYLMIFVFGKGMFGAAIATGIGTAAGAILMLIYLFNKRNYLHVIRIKLSQNSLLLTIRNVGYMCKLGFSSFLCELAIASMMLCGNYVFMVYMGDDGVAAYSIACYFFPIIFMIYTSISQSVQPIISYNYGSGLDERVRRAYIIALKTALITGCFMVLLTVVFSRNIVSMFIDSSASAHGIASTGIPIFALGFIPFAVNMISIGYFQSVERVANATLITVLRGIVFMAFSFLAAPVIFGEIGVWAAVPISELLTFIVLITIYVADNKGIGSRIKTACILKK